MDRKPTLLGYIQEEIMKGGRTQVTTSTDLLGSGVLDSLGILQVVAFIEERFGLQVPDEDVIYENFASVDALDSYLASLAPVSA